MKALKAYFLSRLFREKLLLLGFVAILAGIWLPSLAGRLREALNAYRGAGEELSTQKLILESRERIEKDAKTAVARLDPARTLDAAKLLAEVNRVAGIAGLTSNVQVDDATAPVRSGQFAIHSIRFTVRKADYASLVAFYYELQKQSPYVGIEQFALGADPSAARDAVNSKVLTLVLRISAVEISK
jgi:hypothetical protein